ncbi:hypothetical protein GTY67_20325 [Streptomyces sp. SID8374]|uniref:hypothetical protein n=1 Tax=Streptomyces sp. SID8374 TaxID=2690354 RepID=UPI001367F649|nr:hypothetical protein [Streptomyces sp. SID8374]
MTQSGQGGEQQHPAGRPAHEGVVLPSDGGAPWIPGAPTGGQADQGGQQAGPDAGQAVPAGGEPWGRPWGPQSEVPGQPGGQAQGAYGYPQQAQQPQAQPLPPAQGQDQYGQDQQYGQAYGQGGAGAYQQPHQPQHSDPYQQNQQHQQYPQQQGQPYPPQQQQHHQPQPYAQPLPPEAGAGPGAGQGLPGGDADATQYIAPVPAGGDADATQYIPPVPGGAPYGIRPGAPEDRQPPAEFDNLFRSEGPADATTQMPQQQYHQPQQPQQGYGYPGPGSQLPPQAPQGYQSGLQGPRGGDGAAEPPLHDDGGDAPRRRSAHIPLIAAVVVGCAVVGLGAGALLSGGGDEAKDDKQPVASQSSPATAPTTKAAADPAKPQAEALDKLLADSNNSRAAVISAVEKIKSCKDLDQANTDLRDAAQQRRDLVTRLEGLTLDRLPQHEALNSSLTRAWRASAAADEHYATWARQAKKNKSVCKGGQARSTRETARANEQSGVATKAKQEASGLWNAIAEKYGLTKHTPVEL